MLPMAGRVPQGLPVVTPSKRGDAMEGARWPWPVSVPKHYRVTNLSSVFLETLEPPDRGVTATGLTDVSRCTWAAF